MFVCVSNADRSLRARSICEYVNRRSRIPVIIATFYNISVIAIAVIARNKSAARTIYYWRANRRRGEYEERAWSTLDEALLSVRRALLSFIINKKADAIKD